MDTQTQAHARIEHNMTTHPLTESGVVRVERLRSGFKALAHDVVDLTHTSREASLALTNLEDGLMHAVAAIAREVL